MTADDLASQRRDGTLRSGGTSFVHRITATLGRRMLLALTGGIAYGLAFPDYDLWYLAFVAFAPLFVAIAAAASKREAFVIGWMFYTATWLIDVPWVVRVMSHYGGLPVAVGIALYVLLSLVLGADGGLFALVVKMLRPGRTLPVWLLVAAGWAATDYLRTYLFTGFPWNLTAVTLADQTTLIQLLPWIGPYGLAWIIVVPSALLAWLIVSEASRKTALRAAAIAAALFVAWSFSGLLMSESRREGEPIEIALLQPNISQEMRWDESHLFEIYERMMTMTVDAAESGAEVVIWPESTLPWFFASTPIYQEQVERISSEYGIDILLGSVAEDASDRSRLWNSAYLVSGGSTAGRYDKLRLVPFGEYVPLKKVISFADKLVRAVGDFQFGTNDRPLDGRAKYGPAICYEVVFPQIPAQQVRNGSDLLVTVTNDAWYDGTSAPRQHLNAARLRAVESRRWLLRAATTGISAVVDPYGRMVESIPMGRRGTIRATVERRRGETFYVRHGDWLAGLMCAMVIAGVFVRRRRVNGRNAIAEGVSDE